MTRASVLAALTTAGWNIAGAARALGVSRQSVYNALERFRIERRPMDPAVMAERQRRNVLRRYQRSA